MRVREIMSSPLLTVTTEVSLSDVVKIMKENRISRIVVIHGEKIVGVLTEKDILKRIEFSRKNAAVGKIRAGEIMTKNPITVDPNVTAKRAAEIMLERGIGCLPVVEGMSGVGIVTKLDFAKICSGFEDVYVGEVMQSGLRTVGMSEKFSQCRKIMIEEDLTILPVIEKGILMGNISLMDIVERIVLEEPERVRTLTAAEIMGSPKFVQTDRSLAEIAKIMLSERISGLPVINPEGEFVGLLTKTELVEVARERL